MNNAEIIETPEPVEMTELGARYPSIAVILIGCIKMGEMRKTMTDMIKLTEVIAETGESEMWVEALNKGIERSRQKKR
jgi:hypothetical protein